MRAPFAAQDLRDLREIVVAVTVTGIEDYVNDLPTAGFIDVVATDLTSDWTLYAAARLAAWRKNHGAYVREQGESAYAALEMFYAVVARLYESGSLGGVRLVARRP